MKTYLISYDLIGPETRPEYVNLINEIKNFEDWAKPLYSAWLIKTYLGPREIYARLAKYLDPNDRILIIAVTNEWISLHLHPNVVAWMRKGLTSI